MEENQLKKAIYVLITVIGVLLILSLLPAISIGGLNLRKVNLIADIQADPSKPIVKKDSIVVTETKTEVKRDSCPPGITCIEDFSEDKNALKKFFRSLKDSKRKAVRVAFFGDSFVEGDILCASFRDTLQQLYGGRGVGFVPITSQSASFRTTIQQTFSGWKTYWAVGEKSPLAPLGLSGYCFVPEEDNEVEFRPGKRRNSRFSQLKLFYISQAGASLKYTLNDTLEYEEPLKTSDTLQRTTLSCDGAKVVKLHFEPFDSLLLYGASFEEGAGVYVDNFAMRGNAGMGFFQVEPRELHQFNRFQNYKLIILQYGLNVVTETDTTGYAWYADKMVKVVNRLKEHFPESSILLIGISDRSYNKNGKFLTMPNILLMRDAQREIARRSKIAFWDMFSAMGGENSMVKYVEANPPLAGKDYTHMSFSGGRKLAKKLADAILYDQAKQNAVKKTTP